MVVNVMNTVFAIYLLGFLNRNFKLPLRFDGFCSNFPSSFWDSKWKLFRGVTYDFYNLIILGHPYADIADSQAVFKSDYYWLPPLKRGMLKSVCVWIV